MLLRQIKYFVAIVESNSFTVAAERCYISQSAISQQMAALEAELGVKLFVRSGRKFALTAAGEYFYKNGKSLLQQAERLKSQTARLAEDELRLRIGYIGGYEGKELQQTVYEFTEIYPEVLLSLEKHGHEELFGLISSNDLDLVLSYQRRAFSEQYENLHLRYVPLLAEFSRRRAPAQSKVSAQSLSSTPCIVVANSAQRSAERDFFRDVLGIGSEFIFVENSDDANLAVISGRGFLPVTQLDALPAVGQAVERVAVTDEFDRPICLNYCAFWKKARSNYYIEEFASLFAKKFADAPQ